MSSRCGRVLREDIVTRFDEPVTRKANVKLSSAASASPFGFGIEQTPTIRRSVFRRVLDHELDICRRSGNKILLTTKDYCCSPLTGCRSKLAGR